METFKQLEIDRRAAHREGGQLRVFVVSLDDRGYQFSPDLHAVSGEARVEALAEDRTSPSEENTLLSEERCRQGEERRRNKISLQIAIRAIQLLKRGSVSDKKAEDMEIPVCLFLSHAKKDLDKSKFDKKLVPDDPVRYVMARLQGLPIEQWFDSEQIKPGADFAEAIKRGLMDSTTVVAFLTDCYASRPWCRGEILEAKQRGG